MVKREIAGWQAQVEADADGKLLDDYVLARIGSEPGGCGVMYWYDTRRLDCDECMYADTEALAQRLTFAGHPENPYLHFQTATDFAGHTGSLVGLDPEDPPDEPTDTTTQLPEFGRGRFIVPSRVRAADGKSRRTKLSAGRLRTLNRRRTLKYKSKAPAEYRDALSPELASGFVTYSLPGFVLRVRDTVTIVEIEAGGRRGRRPLRLRALPLD